MKRSLPFFILFALACTSCHVSSRTSMYGSGGRSSYNSSAQNTKNQELLLNLVRLRYSDTPYFLEVANITTQFTFASKALPSVKIPGVTSQNLQDTNFNLGAEFLWQNQPTIQYSPLEGKQFAMQLMSPLHLQMIQSLIHTGWDVDRVFRIIVQSMADIPNAMSASGPIPLNQPRYKKFMEVMELFRKIQKQGELNVGIRYIPSKQPSPSDGDNKGPEAYNSIQLTFAADMPEADRLSDLLEGVKLKSGKYVLNMRQAFNEQAEIGILTRSLLSCMYYLSLGVEVPVKDLVAGIAGQTCCPGGETFDWTGVVGDLFTVKSSQQKPENAYLAVEYRGSWFYISENDLSSKRTFVLLQQIFNLQANQPVGMPPILSIPLG